MACPNIYFKERNAENSSIFFLHGGKMINCIKSEIKTFCFSKVFWIGLLIIFVVPIIFQVNSYKEMQYYAKENIAIIDELVNSGEEVDYSSVEESIRTIYKTLHPQTSINNGLAVLLGLGLIGFPLVFSVYAGKEYKRYTIKPKIVYYSLSKVFLSKIIVSGASLFGFLVIYSIVCFIVSKICWAKYLIAVFDGSGIQFDDIQFSMLENTRSLFLVFVILIFYSLCCMIVSLVCKNSVSGVIATIVLNYVSLPTEFSPHHIFYKLINSCFYQSEVSVFEFKASSYATLPNEVGMIIIVLYFIIALTTILVLGKLQKN